jgi:hypothetical protein
MRSVVLAGLLVFGAAAAAQAQPSLTFSVAQIYHGEIVHVRGTGFTPGGDVLSHLFRPDGSEYPETPMRANDKGEFIHDITIVPNTFGTYELLVEDVKAKASATQRFLMVPVTFDKAVTTQAATLPAPFTGVWQGNVTGQRSASKPLQAMVTVAGGRIGAVVGSVAYPADGCGGELWLVSAAPDSVQLGEVIRYGQDKCSGRALITLARDKDGSLSMLWRDIAGAGTARGTLRKRSE